MVESGTFPTPESDDPQALIHDADADDLDLDAEDEDDDLADIDAESKTQPAAAAEAVPGDEPGPSVPGPFDRFRSAALGAGGWGVERAGFAAAQAATLARAYPRAALASGLSTLVLGGVLAFTPGKKPPKVEIPGPDAPAPAPVSAPEQVGKTAAEGGLDAPAGSNDPEPVARTEVDPPAASPGDLAQNDLPADPAPAPAPEAEAPSLPLPGEPAPSENVKLTSGIGDPNLPALPAVDLDASEPPSRDEGSLPAPALAAAATAGGLGSALELARADVKPGSPPAEPVAPAPVSPPGETGAAPPPEAVPAGPLPQPTPALETGPAEAKPAEPPAVSPSLALPAPIDAGPGPGPAPSALPSTPDPSPAASPAAVPTPTPALDPTPAASPAADPSPSLAAPAAAALAAPAAAASAAPAVKGAAGLLGLGAGLGAAVKGLADKAVDQPAPEATPTPTPTPTPNPDPTPNPAPTIAPQEVPRAPEVQPSQSLDPVLSATPSPAPPPASASPAPGGLPSLGEVPEVAASPVVETPAPASEPKSASTAASERSELTPIRRSGGIVFNDIGAGAGAGPEGDPFDSRSREDGREGETDSSFDIETLPVRDQDSERAPRAARASSPVSEGAGKLETVLHKVESGENFFSISQSYYSSGRYYRALSHANSDKFKRPEDLYVGAVIRVPPPEDLDPAFIDPPGTRYGPKSRSAGSKSTAAAAPKTAAATPIRRGRRGGSEVEISLPVSDPSAERVSSRDDRDDPFEDYDRSEPEAASRGVPTRPVHKVRPDETLRTIARDRLGSGRRAEEILELNRDVIDDPSELIVGQVLQLPEDARGERSRTRP